MKIELLGWKAEGLRCPDIEVNLKRDDESVPRISLIQMPNGTGKTTTLSCLRAAMDGSGERWPASKVESFKCLEETAPTGKFFATLLINSKQELTIEMTFHFEEGVVTYRTIVGSSSKETYAPPPEVRRYLDPRFSELLFFDGETANSLIAGDGTTSASQIIDTFYGLYHANDLKEHALGSYKLREKSSGPAKGAAEAAKLAKKRDRLQERAESLRDQTESDISKLKELEEAQLQIETELEEHLLKSEQFQNDEARAREERESASARLQHGFHELDKIFPDPWAVCPSLAKDVGTLIEDLDQLKLAQQAPRPYLEELAEASVCVCDRPMNDSASSAIRSKAHEALDDSVAGFLKSLNREVASSQESSSDVFDNALDEIRRADNLWTTAQESLKHIRNRAAEAGDQEVASKKEKLHQISAQIGKLKDAISESKRPKRRGDDEKCGCIDYFEKRARDIEDELAKLSGTRDWKYRTDTLVEIIEESYQAAHDALKIEVIARANDRLAQILRYNPVQIKDIGNSVLLDGRGGASVGQTLAVGYVFLAGLLHEGGNQFPLVVDSPVGALDDEARRELGGLLPILTKQMVGFVIASERKWFVDRLEETSDDEVRFLTHLRINGYTKEIISGLKGTRLSQSNSGVLIDGRDAFMALGEDVDRTE